MLKDFYCAYHHNQILTNFCTCTNCLLPVCPICIKLHSEEHQLKQTRPQYESMNKIFHDVQDQLASIQNDLNKQVQQLISIQKQRKWSNKVVKTKIAEYRDRMIREFFRMIDNFQFEISQKIINDDQQFILEMQSIDQKIIKIEKQVQKSANNLKSEGSLRTIISFYTQNKQSEIKQRLGDIESLIENLQNHKIQVNHNDRVLKSMKNMIRQYISVTFSLFLQNQSRQ